MAAIDKIYVKTYDEYLQFKNWCEIQSELEDKYGKKVKLTNYLRKDWKNKEDCGNITHPVMNNPYYVDAYIIRNCPLDFIQKELMECNYPMPIKYKCKWKTPY